MEKQNSQWGGGGGGGREGERKLNCPPQSVICLNYALSNATNYVIEDLSYQKLFNMKLKLF